jgi:PhoH-like ATPase
MPAAPKKIRKIFVLDTSVILYDHNAIMNFEEHDVAIPIPVLEELDEFKKGSDTKNYEAREFIRMLDKKAEHKSLTDWIALNGPKRGKFRVVMDTPGLGVDATAVYGKGKNDHKILNAALYLQEQEPNRPVVLVTKDINLRLKAKALNVAAEDYLTGKVKETDTVFTGRSELESFPEKQLQTLYEQKRVPLDPALKTVQKLNLQPNLFYILKSGKSSGLGFFNAQTSEMELVEKSAYYGIKPRNAEQTFALHAIMNPHIKLVTLTGVAGTGKTLLALAGSLEQRRDFKQIYLARPIVPLSNRDIGFLPGDAEQKINPYMQPLWDNLKFIKNQFGQREDFGHALGLHTRTLAEQRHFHRRRGPKLDAARGQDNHHAGWREFQVHFHRRRAPNRHALPRRAVQRFELPGRPPQGPAFVRPRFARQGRAERVGQLGQRPALIG